MWQDCIIDGTNDDLYVERINWYSRTSNWCDDTNRSKYSSLTMTHGDGNINNCQTNDNDIINDNEDIDKLLHNNNNVNKTHNNIRWDGYMIATTKDDNQQSARNF